MDINSRFSRAGMIATSIEYLGMCIKAGIDDFADKDRNVTVKVLAEREVERDKVTWSIPTKEHGNDLPELYSRINATSCNVKLVRSIVARQGELLNQGVAVVDGGYENRTTYGFVSFQQMKPQMMLEAIINAETTAELFAKNSMSLLDKIMYSDQGQFSVDDHDQNTPYIKKDRVVTTVTYSLKD